MRNNKGVTLIETLVALVIASILLGILTKGIMTASNWRAEGEQLKVQSDTLISAATGAMDASVITRIDQPINGITLYQSSTGVTIPVGSDDSIGSSIVQKTYEYKEGSLKLHSFVTIVN